MIFDVDSLPKRSLLDPKEIGAYMNWLHCKAREYCREAESAPKKNGPLAIKALKRAMSWFLMAGLSDQVEEIVSLLKRPEMKDITAMARASEVTRFLSELPKDANAKLRTKLGITDELPKKKTEILGEFFANSLLLAKNLVEGIDELCSEISLNVRQQ